MANVCCVSGCTVEPANNVYYFKLPTKPALRRQWLAVIKPLSKLGLDASVCSAHFDISDYETVRGKTRLKKNKVPLKIDETKPQLSDDRSSQSTESANSQAHNSTDKPDGKARENGTCSERETGIENGVSGKEIDSNVVNSEAPVNGQDTDEDDPRSIEIQITPDIITDYSTLQVTPDIIEDGNTLKPPDPLDPDINEANPDIEDILTNYHIMNPPDRRDRETATVTEKQESEDKSKNEGETSSPTDAVIVSADTGNASDLKDKPKLADDDVQMVDDDDELPLGVASKPVFIEINVDKERAQEAGGDCLMVLESLQCNIDPTSLMLPDPDEVEEIEIDDKSDDDDDRVKGHDPISLLTSSDSDEVIIEEPHIDCVSVSDETDEDDVPLVKLLNTRFKPKNDVARILWGTYEYYCKHCHFTTYSRQAYNSHLLTHSSSAVIQICQVCGYTTASEYQFTRHKKKHRDERRFKCHLCDYKARHNMSLLYHLKTHEGQAKTYRCNRCHFKSNQKSKIAKHMKTCVRKYSCAKCKYTTKRSSDLKRHQQRRHPDEREWT